MESTVILYIIRTATADSVAMGVPWRIDDREIFFGPCKKKLRTDMREEFLKGKQSVDVEAKRRVLVAGISPSQGKAEKRKIVWAGELVRVMSFAEAWRQLQGPRYTELRNAKYSPIHLEPAGEGAALEGYRHRSKEHSEATELGFSWWDDLGDARSRPRLVQATEDSIQLRPGVSWWQGFPRDACMLLRNTFWAMGSGIEIDQDAIRILSAVQHDREGVDACAPFGRYGGRVNGLRGTYLRFDGRLADDFIAWLHKSVPGRTPDPLSQPSEARRKGCS